MSTTSLRKQDSVAMGSLICLVSYLSVALMGACVKLVPHSVGIGTLIFFQYAIAFILCLPLVYKKGGVASLKTKNFSGHLLRDFAGIVTFGLFFLSLSSISLKPTLTNTIGI